VKEERLPKTPPGIIPLGQTSWYGLIGNALRYREMIIQR